MFGFIKKLIAGILSFFTGLIGGKKSGGYYLELKEDTTAEKPVAPAPQAAPAASNGTKPAVKAEAPPATEKSPAPTAVKAAKVEASKNGKTAPKPAEPEKAPVAKTTTPAETTFAPKYLAPSASGSNGRRRPGANMSSFLDLARQVKTPG